MGKDDLGQFWEQPQGQFCGQFCGQFSGQFCGQFREQFVRQSSGNLQAFIKLCNFSSIAQTTGNPR